MAFRVCAEHHARVNKFKEFASFGECVQHTSFEGLAMHHMKMLIIGGEPVLKVVSRAFPVKVEMSDKHDTT
jgi:hypothetical protein